MSDTYSISRRDDGKPKGCIDLCESPDDDGWYAQEYDFTQDGSVTRTSTEIYPTRSALVAALDDDKHQWENWS